MKRAMFRGSARRVRALAIVVVLVLGHALFTELRDYVSGQNLVIHTIGFEARSVEVASADEGAEKVTRIASGEWRTVYDYGAHTATITLDDGTVFSFSYYAADTGATFRRDLSLVQMDNESEFKLIDEATTFFFSYRGSGKHRNYEGTFAVQRGKVNPEPFEMIGSP